MEIVNDRTAATLLSIIEDHTHNGTIIWSDIWAAYNNMVQIRIVYGIEGMLIYVNYKRVLL